MARANVNYDYPEWVWPIVQNATSGTSIPPELLLSLLRQESGFNTRAVSSAGARGIAQFMPATAREYGVDPYDPVSAINGAARYLQRYYSVYGDWAKTLAFYNAGPGNVHRYQQIPETSNYVRSILSMYMPQGRVGQPQQVQQKQQPQQQPQSQRILSYSRNVNQSTQNIPQAQNTPQAQVPNVNSSRAGQYTVQTGDTLWDIARRILGSGTKWGDLRGYSGDPRKLPVGTRLNY